MSPALFRHGPAMALSMRSRRGASFRHRAWLRSKRLSTTVSACSAVACSPICGICNCFQTARRVSNHGAIGCEKSICRNAFCRASHVPVVKADFDVAIVGSGFSGSLLAMIAKRLGRSVVLIERGSHPRFAIGESSTPLANLLLEEIATTYDLPRLRPLCEWGPWQRAYPEVTCGLKRGFTFYHHELDRPWTRRADRANELLVAASPHDEVADTHWYRAEFDEFLVHEAQGLGVEYLDETELTSAAPSPRGLRLEGARDGKRIDIAARFAVDATGPRGFLHRAFNLPASHFQNLPPIEALFTHFVNVHRWDELMPCPGPPYPPDDAAVHHIFPGGWIWVLRFGNGITSAGVAAVAGQFDL